MWCLVISCIGCGTSNPLPQSAFRPGDVVLIMETIGGEEYKLEQFEFLPDSSVSGEGYMLLYRKIPFRGKNTSAQPESHPK